MSACPREGKLQEAARPQVQEHTPFPRTGKLQFVIDQKQNLPQFQIRLPKVKGRLQPLAQANLFTHDNPASAGKTPRRRAAQRQSADSTLRGLVPRDCRFSAPTQPLPRAAHCLSRLARARAACSRPYFVVKTPRQA